MNVPWKVEIYLTISLYILPRSLKCVNVLTNPLGKFIGEVYEYCQNREPSECDKNLNTLVNGKENIPWELDKEKTPTAEKYELIFLTSMTMSD